MSRRRRRVLGATAVALGFALGACSDEGGDTEAFCRLIGDNRALLIGVSADRDADAEALAVYDEVVDVAPEEIRSEARRLQQLLEDVQEQTRDDETGYVQAFAALFEREVRDAAEDFTSYVEDTCQVSLRGTAEDSPVPTTAAR